MMKLFCLTLLLFLCIITGSLAQSQDSTIYPYVLPIWGQKVQDRGFGDQLQLPFGLNINYVNAYVELEVPEFELLIGDRDLTGIINTETLNFTQVDGTTNGINLRADAWILPFMNVYGLLSWMDGGTNVSLQPTWRDAVGDIILQLPEFSSSVDFGAFVYGAGTTLVFGWDGYFTSVDMNYSRTDTDLLKEQIGYLTMSARLGHRFFLNSYNQDFFIAPYVGVMYRNFVGAKGSSGSIGVDEVFPGLDATFNERIDQRVSNNEDIINDPATPVPERIKLQAQNQALRTIQSRVNESGFFTSDIDYFIRKDLVQKVTFQFGFNLQFNKNWMLRGEYGIADSQRFIMTGLQYRFGVKKRELR